MDFQYRDSSYFNEQDIYKFKTAFTAFESKVHFIKGYWWTKESLHYKCTTIKSVKLNK